MATMLQLAAHARHGPIITSHPSHHVLNLASLSYYQPAAVDFISRKEL
jgi:hypothetical protein